MKKYLPVLTLLFVLLLEIAPAHAFFALGVGVDIDQPITVIGGTEVVKLTLVTDSATPLKVNSLNCRLTGSSVVQTSSYGLPSSISASNQVQILVYYRAVSAGDTLIECTLVATNPSTGEQRSATTSNEIFVLGETRLYVTAYSASQVATVGQSVFIIVKFGNRGNTPFTGVGVFCSYFSDALMPVSIPTAPPTLQPGQSTFIETRWLAVHPGRAGFDCFIRATDSSGTQVEIPAPRVIVNVK